MPNRASYEKKGTLRSEAVRYGCDARRFAADHCRLHSAGVRRNPQSQNNAARTSATGSVETANTGVFHGNRLTIRIGSFAARAGRA